jgi:hypothetical protein
VQHALRAYTPAELKRVKAAAESFRPNPKFDTQTAINELGTGEALVSFLDQEGRPSIVERCFILPPQSQFGTLDDAIRSQIITSSPMRGKYDQEIDRESAYELLQAKVKQEQDALMKQKDQQARLKQWEREEKQRSSRSTGSKGRKQTSIVGEGHQFSRFLHGKGTGAVFDAWAIGILQEILKTCVRTPSATQSKVAGGCPGTLLFHKKARSKTYRTLMR